MKNHKILLSNLRKIKSSYKRFISLLFLSMLGVGFFVGIKATSPNMLNTLDDYLDTYNVYDMEIISTLGLTEEDLVAIENLHIADELVPVKWLDEIVFLNNQEKIIKITSLSSINEVRVIEGNLPKENNEIVVEKNLLKENDLQIGDTLKINNASLINTELKIVGAIESPIYFTSSRGTTTIGNGELTYYTYANENLFVNDYYNSIYLTLNDTKELITGSDKYLEKIKEATKLLETIKEEREQKRWNALYEEKFTYMESQGIQIDKEKFPKAVWYILDRTDNQGYNTFVDATESLTKLGSVFPLVFYIVAILISLISMTRMVAEDRTEIGTLKGLGFSNLHIISKYLLYSSLATITGGCIGMLIGFNLLPRIIWNIYTSLFFIPTFVCEFHFYYAIMGLSIALLCICGATIASAYKSLREKPSILMRPAAPKVGKKIALERINFIWSKLKFSNKITIRNIFRYKKRILVTIIGIAGSTSLILVGFGLKDSITNVVDYNYNHVFVYDEMISLKTNSDTTSLKKLLKENEDIEANVEAVYEKKTLYNENKDSIEVNLIAPMDEQNFSEVIKLNDLNNKKETIILTNNSIVLSEKLAKTLNIEVNDKASFLINNEYQEVVVKYIVENYVNDYVYMTKNTYENVFGDFNSNVIFLKNGENYDSNFNKKIMGEESVSNLMSTDAISDLLEKVLSSLNSVIVILIVASATLAFVILYNLSTINISERKREISTLKVLGFYDEEVDSYITKENYFITIIGIVIGLYFGLYLSHYIISTCEPEFVMFIRHIEFSSYIISAVISLLGL